MPSTYRPTKNKKAPDIKVTTRPYEQDSEKLRSLRFNYIVINRKRANCKVIIHESSKKIVPVPACQTGIPEPEHQILPEPEPEFPVDP